MHKNVWNISEMRFGRLIAKEYVGNSDWKCLCDCGAIIVANSWNLHSGNTQSCGCYKKERISEVKLIDLTGMTFGRLTVLERDMNSKNNNTKWICKCSCGNIKSIVSSSLKNGDTKSCGCLASELTSERSKKYNNYDLTQQEYGIGFTDNGMEFYFDIDDFDKIKNYCWSIDHYGYAITRNSESKKLMKMHRLLLSPEINVKIDHANRNKNDNRRENLRIATNSQNLQNKPISSTNTSGIIGVGIHKTVKKWRAYIEGEHLGLYDHFEDAVRVRLTEEKIRFGEFAPQRHLFEEYGIS